MAWRFGIPNIRCITMGSPSVIAVSAIRVATAFVTTDPVVASMNSAGV